MASRIFNSQIAASVKRAGARFQSTAAAQSDFLVQRDAVKAHAASSASTWKKISIYVVIPALAAASLNTYNLYEAHVEHQKHHPKEWVRYPYINFRARQAFWGPESYFFNPKVNLSVKEE
ncbi:Cytochrome c oxidase subunit 6A [Rhizopus stolonifer]|uniref:Cytochrome c oxidase subunit 6A n=1 Tax=Rhizopus stolonifer TaxID=4846 RepID=A0A367KW76_RHIST|nr:Cytochrome c oxidase subunit 6A [Rhizopus stolonifer]